jgi:hypothetical protein
MELYLRKKLLSLFYNRTLVTLDSLVWDGPSSNLRHYSRKKQNPFRSSLIPAPSIHSCKIIAGVRSLLHSSSADHTQQSLLSFHAAAAAPSFIQIL